MFTLFFIVLWLTVWYTRAVSYVQSDMTHPFSKASAVASLVTATLWLYFYIA